MGEAVSQKTSLEEDLMEWITERRASKLRVSRKLIMFKARSMHKERVGEDAIDGDIFVASRGWIEHFKFKIKKCSVFNDHKATNACTGTSAISARP